MDAMIGKLRFKFRIKRETQQNALLKRLTQQTPSGRTGYRGTVVCYVTIKRRKERGRKKSIAMRTDHALKLLTCQTQNKAG